MSILTLLNGTRSWGAVIQLLRGWAAVVSLRSGPSFKARTLMDLWIIKETSLDRDYESFGVAIQDGWTVVDIGAGLGDFAVSVGRRLPKARVFAYEPFAESFALLRENMARNQVRNVTAVMANVAAHSGILTLARSGAAVQHTNQQGTSEPVPAVGLADLIATHRLKEIDFLKIDCEGGEFDILLRTPDEVVQRIDHIALEYHNNATPHHHTELVKRLAKAGFTVATRPSPVHSDLGLLFAVNRRLGD